MYILFYFTFFNNILYHEFQENTISKAPSSESQVDSLPPFPCKGADNPLGELGTLDPRHSSRDMVELHLKVSELEEENLLLKVKKFLTKNDYAIIKVLYFKGKRYSFK